MTCKQIPARLAVQEFHGQDIKVLTVAPAKGSEASGEGRKFDIKREPLAERHVLSATKSDDGVVTIFTTDGQRLVVACNPEEDAPQWRLGSAARAASGKEAAV